METFLIVAIPAMVICLLTAIVLFQRHINNIGDSASHGSKLMYSVCLCANNQPIQKRKQDEDEKDGQPNA
jgi:hypothetical protein